MGCFHLRGAVSISPATVIILVHVSWDTYAGVSQDIYLGVELRGEEFLPVHFIDINSFVKGLSQVKSPPTTCEEGSGCSISLSTLGVVRLQSDGYLLIFQYSSLS